MIRDFTGRLVVCDASSGPHPFDGLLCVNPRLAYPGAGSGDADREDDLEVKKQLEETKMESKSVLPKEIFARLMEPSEREVDARLTAEEFDEVGLVGRYQLVEEGTITIETAFVPYVPDGARTK